MLLFVNSEYNNGLPSFKRRDLHCCPGSMSRINDPFQWFQYHFIITLFYVGRSAAFSRCKNNTTAIESAKAGPPIGHSTRISFPNRGVYSPKSGRDVMAMALLLSHQNLAAAITAAVGAALWRRRYLSNSFQDFDEKAWRTRLHFKLVSIDSYSRVVRRPSTVGRSQRRKKGGSLTH